MKRFKKVFMALAFIFAGVLAFSLASNTKVHAEGTTVTYTVTAKDAVSTTGTAPTGSTATYSQTYQTTAGQITKDNSATLSLAGWTGNKITGLVLSMHSNGSKGTGGLTVTAGKEEIASIPNSTFANANWHGSYTTDWVDKTVTLSDADYTIREGENVQIVISVTVNSLFIQSYTITYETGTITQTTPIDEFKDLDLQEQLAFDYHYDNAYSYAESVVSGNKYLLGYVKNDITYVAVSEVSNALGISAGVNQAFDVTIEDSSIAGYFAIIENSKYIATGSSTYITKNAASSYDGSDKYLWSFDASTGKIVNKANNRFLGINESNTEIRAYSNDSYAIARFMTASLSATFKDAANNADRVTMRIGYTISKTLYESLEALGTTVTFGVRLNDTTNVECTKVVADENTYKLFVAVNNIPLDKIDTVITACGYVSVDGTDTYTTEVNTYSVKTLAQEYLTNHADNEAVVTAKYALVYLAYYA